MAKNNGPSILTRDENFVTKFMQNTGKIFLKRFLSCTNYVNYEVSYNRPVSVENGLTAPVTILRQKFKCEFKFCVYVTGLTPKM